MKSIKEVLDANKLYEVEHNKYVNIVSKIYKTNDEINLEEVKDKLNYEDSKNLYNIIRYRNNNENMIKQFEKIIHNKKIEEYPQILDVHYYPEIKEIDFLSKEEKIKLDAKLMILYKHRFEEKLTNLDDKTLEFLIDNKILEKQYIFHCTCNSDDCYDKVITEPQFQELKDYWKRETLGQTTHEEDSEMGYGCFETGCWNDGNIEVSCLEDFNKYLRKISYKIIKKPDMTLDNI